MQLQKARPFSEYVRNMRASLVARGSANVMVRNHALPAHGMVTDVFMARLRVLALQGASNRPS